MTERTRPRLERALAPLLALESEELRGKRLRALAALPFLALVGFATALVLARDRGIPFLEGWALVVAGFGLLLFAAAVLEALGRALLRSLDRAFAAGFVTLVVDALLGAAMGAVLAGSSREPWYAAVGLCAVFLPLYNLVVAQLVFGGAVEWAWSGLFFGGPALAPQYSRADALAARGLYDDAVASVLAECRRPDAATFARIGRMLRDGRRFEDAADWLKRGLAHATDPALELQLARELCELYTRRLGTPARCAPVLARLADLRKDTAPGEWARAELAELKTTLRGAADA